MRVQIGIGSLLSAGLLSLNAFAQTTVSPAAPPAEGAVPVQPVAPLAEESVAPELAEEAAPVEPVEEGSDTAVSDNSSFEFGLRAGFGLPLGEISKDAKMNDRLMGQIP